MRRIDKLVDILKWIHIDLVVIATILICFVLFKDCHGHSHSGIVDELKNIESTIANKKYGSDYKWNDNHEELIRCKDCKYCGSEMGKGR